MIGSGIGVAAPFSLSKVHAFLVKPRLAGSGQIGTVLTVGFALVPGGVMTACQWRRNGEEIAGATGTELVLEAGHDLAKISCAITAEVGGTPVTAVSNAMVARHVAPQATGSLEDATFALDSGPQVVDAAPAFTGLALTYAAEGTGASADPASGHVTIPTGTAAKNEEIRVTAANSGGEATAVFQVTVVAFPSVVGSFPGVSLVEGDSATIPGETVRAVFAGDDLSFAVSGEGATIDAGQTIVIVGSAVRSGPDAVVTVTASSPHGPDASATIAVTVEAVPEVVEATRQVLRFAGGLKQTVVPFNGGAVGATGIWMSAWAYYDGTTWGMQALMSLADATRADRQLVLLTNRALYWHGAGIGPVAMATPASPGWYLCTARFTYPGTPAARLWRNGDYAAATTHSSNSNISGFDTLTIGYRPNGPATLTVPACGFAWGYGDPAAAHAWAYNGGDYRELARYDFDNDADCTLKGYWRGTRVDDATPFDPTHLGAEIGELDAWTAVGGGAAWADIPPPFPEAAGGVPEGNLPGLPLPVVTLLGSGLIGTTLSVEVETAATASIAAPSYRWQADGEDLPEEAEASLEVRPEHDRAELCCVVTTSVGNAVSNMVKARYTPPQLVGPDEALDEIFDVGTGHQAVDVTPRFSGKGLRYSVDSNLMTIEPDSGLMTIPTDAPFEGEEVRVTAANSGGEVGATYLITVEDLGGVEANQVITFAGGNNGLRQTVPVLAGGNLPVAGIWMSAWAYYDGATWGMQALMSLANAGVNNKQLVLLTNRSLFWHGGNTGPADMSTPAAPGWYLCTARFTAPGVPAARFWRNEASGASPGSAAQSDISDFTTLTIGYRPSGPSTLTVPACGFAWGTGDPAAAHAWAYNGGDYRELADYDFATDGRCSLAGYWAGYRSGDGTPFDSAMQMPDEVGGLDAWTPVGGGASWVDLAPPFARGAALTAVRSIEMTAPSELVVTAALPGNRRWSRKPEVDPSRLDLWTPRGFGPIRATGAAVQTAGGEARIVLTLNRNIHASEQAIKLEMSSNWLSSEEGIYSSIERLEVANTSSLTAPAVTGLSIGRIAWRFSEPRVAGFYQDGVGYVVDDGKGVTIVEEYPATTTAVSETRSEDGPVPIHGAMKNPRRMPYDHGYDGRNVANYGQSSQYKYNAGLNQSQSLPVSLRLHDSYVKGRSNQNPWSALGGSANHPVYMEQYAGLVVVDRVPGENEIAPPLVGYDGTKARPKATLDVGAIAAALPRYSTAGQDRPSIGLVAARLGRENPVVGQIQSVEDRRHLTPSGMTQADGYGLKMAELMNAAGLCLIGDDEPSEKEAIVRGLAHHGWQWWCAVQDGKPWWGDGGHDQFQLLPIICALAWTGNGAEIGNIRAKAGAMNYFAQTFMIDDDMVTRVTRPWGNPGDFQNPDNYPWVSHRKKITAVAGTLITCGDMSVHEVGMAPVKFNYPGLLLKRESDGATAKIAAQNFDACTFTVVAQPAAPFKVGDVVHAVPIWNVRAGVYDWSLKGIRSIANALSAATSYRSLNAWSGQVMAIRAMGLMHPSFHTMEGYVVRANTPNDPQGDDYPAHHSGFVQTKEEGGVKAYSWDAAFWNAHWPVIAKVASPLK